MNQEAAQSFDHWTVQQWLDRANDLVSCDDRSGTSPREAWEQAVGCCVKAQSLEPENPLVHGALERAFYGLGFRYESEGDVRNAMAAYRRAQMFPGSWLSLIRERLSKLLLRTARYEEAIAECDQALAERPHALGPQHVRATALQELERYDEAIEAYDAFIASHPLNPDVVLEKLDLLVQLKRYAQALEAAEHVLRMKPGRMEVLEARVCLLARLGRGEDAKAALEDLLAANRSEKP